MDTVRAREAEISIHTPAQGVTEDLRKAPPNTFISIHTPAQGVTKCADSGSNPLSISIHTPAQGVTGLDLISAETVLNFNPHSRTGSDIHGLLADLYVPAISIHTPAQGVTVPRSITCEGCCISIHTPAQGVTRLRLHMRRQLLISIHTPAQGVTISEIRVFYNFPHFNPHSRTGSDRY